MKLDKTKPIRRIAVYFFYDKDGIVDDYSPYLLRDLVKNIEKLIFVSNGPLTAESKEKLAEFTLQKPATSISLGVMTALIDGRSTVIKDGRIGWVRLVDGDGVAVADYDVGLAGSGADFTLSTLDVNKDSALELSNAILES